MNIQHVIDLLNRAELYDEASDVSIMAEQNKELLEALKNAQALHPCAMYAEAITKAELSV